MTAQADTQPQSDQQGRLMILITALTFGGAETQAVSLAEEFKGRGWEVCFVCLMDPVAYVDRVQNRGIEIHSLGMRRGIPNPAAILRLRELIRAFEPTIIHSHMFHANLLGRVARLFFDVPRLVCTIHNLKETSEKGGPTWHKDILYRITDHLADKTTIICAAARERYEKVQAVPVSKLQTIPNGVDTQVYSSSKGAKKKARQELGLGNEFVWLAVGRLVPQKDHENLLDALEQLGTSAFTLLIVGGGPLEKKLRDRRDQSFFREKIWFCGEHENILPFYQAADGFVMSSEFEGLSVALLEAASTGLPAVVTDVGGNAEVVIDEETGYLVPPGNPAQLAAAMRNVMDFPPDRWQLFSGAARRHVIETFRFPIVMDKWVNLYVELTEDARTSGRDESVSKADPVMAK